MLSIVKDIGLEFAWNDFKYMDCLALHGRLHLNPIAEIEFTWILLNIISFESDEFRCTKLFYL